MSTNTIGWRSGKLPHDLADIPKVNASFPKNLEAVMTLIGGGITYEEAYYLAEKAAQVQSGCIMEVGSFKGRSAVAMSMGLLSTNSTAQIYCVEPHMPFVGVNGGQFGPDDRAQFYKAMLATGAYQNTSLINLSSEDISAAWHQPISLCFIDGDHTFEGVKRDFECWKSKIVIGGLLVFDDAMKPNLGPTQLKPKVTALPEWGAIDAPGKFAAFRKIRTCAQ